MKMMRFAGLTSSRIYGDKTKVWALVGDKGAVEPHIEIFELIHTDGVTHLVFVVLVLGCQGKEGLVEGVGEWKFDDLVILAVCMEDRSRKRWSDRINTSAAQ